MYNEYGQVFENANLKEYNTYRINTSCSYLVFPETEEKAAELIGYLNVVNTPYFILGNGSNVILSDNKFNGVVISLKKLNKIEIKDDLVIAEAGIMMPILVNEVVNNNLKGLEWASGIPGTLGGSIYGNAGAYLSEIMEFVVSIDVCDKSGNIKTIFKDEIEYGYRTTSLKENKEYVILSATLKLEHGNKEESLELMDNRRKRRLDTQPLDYPSAGSVFRNPSKDLPAGKLIEDAHLKGMKLGDAEISLKHGNFIINKGNAKAQDIKGLIDIITNKIEEKDGIKLICEQEIVDWK